MLRKGDSPEVGEGPDMLGARPGEIHLVDGHASPGRGMSVAPDWRELPYHRIPRRFSRYVPDARGRDTRSIWQAGEGPFVDTELTAALRLVVDGPTHGRIEPSAPMPVPDYQASLAGTRGWWRPIPEDPGTL